MRIVLTGFEPFRPHDVNPSWEAAAALDGTEVAGARVRALRLPVSWTRAADLVVEAAASLRPAAIVMAGLAAGRPCVSVERIFVNLRSGRDSDGAVAQDEPVVEGGPTAHAPALPASAIVEALCSAGIPAVLSHTAGTYICNATAYAVVHRLPRVAAAFIHVPATPQIVARQQARAAAEGKEPPSTASMAQEAITAALCIAAEVAVRRTDG